MTDMPHSYCFVMTDMSPWHTGEWEAAAMRYIAWAVSSYSPIDTDRYDFGMDKALDASVPMYGHVYRRA